MKHVIYIVYTKYFVFNYKMKQIFISYHGSKYNLYSLMFIVFNLCEHFPDDINLAIHKYNFLNSIDN